MPKRAKAEKEKKRRTVAKAAIAGKGTKVVAKEAGCSVRHVQRLQAEPETQFLITEALAPQRDELRKLATQVISAIGGALKATKTDKADHAARLRAVARYNDVVELAQGKVSEANEQGPMKVTWEEFCLMYKARKVTTNE